MYVKDAYDFLEEFEKAYSKDGKAVKEVDADSLDLRRTLIEEEFQELMKEFLNLKFIKIRDGKVPDKYMAPFLKELCDLMYVLVGTAVVFDLPLYDAFREVHRSNMSKLGEDGKPIYRDDGKVLKGPNYSPADILEVLKKGN